MTYAPGAFKRRDPSPSLSMQPVEGGGRRRCRWIEDSLTIHSDGNVSCGLDDPHALRSFGNVRQQPIAVVFANPEFERLTARLTDGWGCANCSLHEPDDRPFAPPPRPKLPKTLIIEPTVTCNLRCPNEACEPNNAPGGLTRDGSMLRLETFASVIDQVGDGLSKVYFFNYGDPFMNRQAEAMLAYLRSRCPDVDVETSTNAIPLSNVDRATAVVQAEPTCVVVTLSGMTQESYARYHVRGQLAAALQGLRNLVEAKRSLGLARPYIVWRYLLFRWNDSEEEIARAITLANELGVKLSLFLTHVPVGSASYRLSPGSPSYEKYRERIDVAHAYNCEVPGPDGLFSAEVLPGLGPVRWTTWRATLDVPNEGGWLEIELSTNRAVNAGDEQRVEIRTPWGKILTLQLAFMEWRKVRIRIPWSHRRKRSISLYLETPNYWFPAEVSGSADLRCLGFLVRQRPEPKAIKPSRFSRWFGAPPHCGGDPAAAIPPPHL